MTIDWNLMSPLSMKKLALAKFKSTIVFIYSVSSVGTYNLICTSNLSDCPNDEHRVTNIWFKKHVIQLSQHHSDYAARAARISSWLCIGSLLPPPPPCYPVHCAQFLLHRLVGLYSGQPFPRVLMPLQLRIRTPIPMTRTSSQMIKENRMNRA